MANLRLEFDETNQRQFGPCECCGQMTSRVWGYVYESSLVGRALDRNEVIGQPIASQIFAICDAIYDYDPRIPEILG